MIPIEVRLAELVRPACLKAPDSPPEGHPDATIWCDYGFKWAAYAFAHLHRTPHPDNPLFGQDWCVELAVRLLDKCTETWRWRKERGLDTAGREAPHYVAAAVIEWMGRQVPADSLADWTAKKGELRRDGRR